MEETISLKELFDTLKKRFAMILLITVIAIAISGIISYMFLTPIYQSSTQILVNQSNEGQQNYDINQVRTNVEMINTYRVIIKSPTILEKVQQDLGLEESTSQLNNVVTVNSEQNSQVFTVSVQHAEPEMVAEIANSVASTFESEIKTIMNVDNVKILSKAEVPISPIKPSPMLNMAIALVVGLMAGVGLAFLLEYIDNTIKNEQDIEKQLDLPVLGVIAEMNEKQIQQSNRMSKARVGSERFEA
ncbi:YveK family protein [Pseudalkalibacillus berkeleyi]|uniref:Wzz/FepE/Etk N-terminal domain-containing protein n=1 Tax=Pseudalkalibacillus berkeleyi TaxID=1069813 RepID=A0ABS9H4W6_9BACL|nr:Wzz/FepE/Etk N-terminal domain-containing protein [Pseudalkalibacillus berkeleyi]MCF6138833.1 Wzz/FepE/Etk N-terminal domain-containing protein [Pseudalkalibacillus berkeleyi]